MPDIKGRLEKISVNRDRGAKSIIKAGNIGEGSLINMAEQGTASLLP